MFEKKSVHLRLLLNTRQSAARFFSKRKFVATVTSFARTKERLFRNGRLRSVQITEASSLLMYSYTRAWLELIGVCIGYEIELNCTFAGDPIPFFVGSD